MFSFLVIQNMFFTHFIAYFMCVKFKKKMLLRNSFFSLITLVK